MLLKKENDRFWWIFTVDFADLINIHEYANYKIYIMFQNQKRPSQKNNLAQCLILHTFYFQRNDWWCLNTPDPILLTVTMETCRIQSFVMSSLSRIFVKSSQHTQLTDLVNVTKFTEGTHRISILETYFFSI